MIDQQPKTQQTLEQQLATFASTPIPEDKTIQEIFGPLEDWVLNLEGRSLLLHPVEKAWYYYDTLHKTWERTGFGPGEATFLTVDGRLGFQISETQKPQPPDLEEAETVLRPMFRYALEVLSPEFSSSVPVTGSVVVGRGKECDIRLDDKLSSRSHARIDWDGNTLHVEDLGTTNGTKVNGEKIRQATRLQAGDLILVGKTVLRVIAAGEGTE